MKLKKTSSLGAPEMPFKGDRTSVIMPVQMCADY